MIIEVVGIRRHSNGLQTIAPPLCKRCPGTFQLPEEQQQGGLGTHQSVATASASYRIEKKTQIQKIGKTGAKQAKTRILSVLAIFPLFSGFGGVFYSVAG